MTRNEAEHFVKECYRVLKQGGLIRIVVPDLQIAIDRYNLTGDADELMEGLAMGGRGREPHQWLYNFRSLTMLLERYGFTEIKRVSEGQGDMPEADKLDTRHGEHHLRVEARKPTSSQVEGN